MLECGLPSAQVTQHQLFAVCFDRFPCEEGEQRRKTVRRKQWKHSSTAKTASIFSWNYSKWCNGTVIGFHRQENHRYTHTHTYTGLWARHTMIDIQSLWRVSYQTVSMPPSEVILQLWSAGMQNIRNTSWNFSVHNLNLTKPHSLSTV